MITFKQYLIENDLDDQLKKLGLSRSKKYGVGKEIGGNIYVHKQYENVFPKEELKKAKSLLPKDFEYHVVKYNPATKVFSFVVSKDFNINPEPIINGGITVSPEGEVKTFPEAGWIYHHKWMWVADDYTGFDVEESKKRSLEWGSLPNIDRSRIGQKKYWNVNIVPLLKESLNTLKYSARRDREGGLMVTCYDTNKQDINGEPLCIAHLHVPVERIRWNRFSVGDVDVTKEYRRQGIATKMYELAEKKLKTKATPSEIRSPDAIEFWKKREL